MYRPLQHEKNDAFCQHILLIYRIWIGFIDHFSTRLVTTFNYSAIANLHTLQITIVHAKYSQSDVSSPVVHWYWLLTAGILQLHRPSLLFTDYLTNFCLLSVTNF
jgi:hypothetical protein